MPATSCSPDGPFGRLADRLLRLELPDLPAERRGRTVDFVCDRVNSVATHARLGVLALAGAVTVGERVLGPRRATSFLAATRLPVVGELPRLIRSLGFAYVWATWPATSPTGAP